jgi:acyl-CoA reductase-like NAD-dependent aldehyde dehydrogenase
LLETALRIGGRRSTSPLMRRPLTTFSGELVGSAAAATREDAGAAVEAVQAAFLGWSAMPSAERRRPLERAGDC